MKLNKSFFEIIFLSSKICLQLLVYKKYLYKKNIYMYVQFFTTVLCDNCLRISSSDSEIIVIDIEKSRLFMMP